MATKKEIIEKAYKSNPGISVADAMDISGCTERYAIQILGNLQMAANSELIDIGRQLGIKDDRLEAWHQWILIYINSEAAAKEFNLRYDVARMNGNDGKGWPRREDIPWTK